ncbi:hypothetical protein K440DRAFT_646545 [Wilcoxina mikolae CBS 423.85]|nr:hypothetical protein K440DRAFT_646545 [Wilcoxina mikolae CBS 423.85]
MDGISVAASVAGLLQVGAKIVGFISTMTDAPSLASNIRHQTEALIAIFGQMQEFLTNSNHPGNESRKSMPHVNQIVAALTGCVCAFSELEKELESLQRSREQTRGLTLWDSVLWTQKDQTFQRLLKDLEGHKSSLTLMLMIYNCNSQRQARKCMEELSELMKTILETNPDLAARMTTTYPRDDSSDASTIRSLVSASPRFMSFRSSFGFERALEQSRVYAKAWRNKSTTSFESLTTTESNWSQLTGLSQTSCIAVVRLPISAPELYNSAPYVDHELRQEISETTRPSMLIDDVTCNLLMVDQSPTRYMHSGEAPSSQFAPGAPVNEIPNFPAWRTKGFHLGPFDFELPDYDSDGISNLVKQTQPEETSPALASPQASKNKSASPVPEFGLENDPELATQSMDYDADEDEPLSTTTSPLQYHKSVSFQGEPLIEIQTPRVELQFGHGQLADDHSRDILRFEIAKIVRDAIMQQDMDSTQPHVFMSSQEPLSVVEYRELQRWQYDSDDDSLADILERFRVGAAKFLQPRHSTTYLVDFKPEPSKRYQMEVSDCTSDVTVDSTEVIGSTATLSTILEVNTSSDSVSDLDFGISEVTTRKSPKAEQPDFLEQHRPHDSEIFRNGVSSTHPTELAISGNEETQTDAHTLDRATPTHLVSGLEIERAEITTSTSWEIPDAEHSNPLGQLHLGAIPPDQPHKHPAEAIPDATEDIPDADQNEMQTFALEPETCDPISDISSDSNEIAEMAITDLDKTDGTEKPKTQIPNSTLQPSSAGDPMLEEPIHLPESIAKLLSAESALEISNPGMVWAYAILLLICAFFGGVWWVG